MLLPTSILSPSSLPYLGFVLVVLVIYYFLARRAQRPVLWLASLAFCAAWEPSFVLVLLASSAVNYGAGLGVGKGGRGQKLWLYGGIILNLAGLLAFKYVAQTLPYTLPILRDLGLAVPPLLAKIVQPIGISFYTLQAISYLLDVKRGQLTASRNFIEVSLYIAYFPKLLAGPIERAGAFFDQLRQPQDLDNQRLAEAVVKIVVGFVRKLVIADAIAAQLPLSLFDEPSLASAPQLLFWWLVYAFVLYNDFAGYTSIARGVSELFGIRLSPNFEQPFFSTGYMDFWNRWHISLSHWLRDYIYLPLSRALLRRNPGGRYIPNLVVPPLVTMLVSGLWHGAAPHFIFWGLLNGALQGMERVFKSRQRVTGARPPRWRLILSIVFTLVTMILFSAPFLMEVPESFMFWAALLNWSTFAGLTVRSLSRPVLAMGLSLLIDAGSLPARDETGWLRHRPRIQAAALAAALLLLFLATRQHAPAPFIYQEF